ncbi:hypothetical protein JCM5350_005564 [Sporobolomyces pararoseus]
MDIASRQHLDSEYQELVNCWQTAEERCRKAQERYLRACSNHFATGTTTQEELDEIRQDAQDQLTLGFHVRDGQNPSERVLNHYVSFLSSLWGKELVVASSIRQNAYLTRGVCLTQLHDFRYRFFPKPLDSFVESPFWLKLGQACSTFLLHCDENISSTFRNHELYPDLSKLFQIDAVSANVNVFEDLYRHDHERKTVALKIKALSKSGQIFLQDVKVIQTIIQARPRNFEIYLNLPTNVLATRQDYRTAIMTTAHNYSLLLTPLVPDREAAVSSRQRRIYPDQAFAFSNRAQPQS